MKETNTTADEPTVSKVYTFFYYAAVTTFVVAYLALRLLPKVLHSGS
jgi:hypothetical protein